MKRLGIAALALAAMPILLTLWLSTAQQARGSAANEMSVVAPPAVIVGDEFSADINISAVAWPYAGYQAYLEWDDTVLAYVDPPGVTYTGLSGMVLDATPNVLADGVQLGSARISGTSTQTGTASRVRLECVGAGTSVLHLVALYEDPAFGTTLLCFVDPECTTWLVDDAVTCMNDPTTDNDGDGCSWTQEASGAPAPYPGFTCSGSGACYSDSNPYDFYDVPVPARADPAPNGARNGAVTMIDVLAVLRYVGTQHGRGPVNGVDYDSDKNGDTIKDGADYDRSSGPGPNPPWEAGPPDGAVSMFDIMVMLPQVGLNCAAPPL